jgi:regulator of ribonuclease activity A
MAFKTADLCDEYGDQLQILSPGLRDFGGREKFFGEIVTVKLFEDNSLLRELVAAEGRGRVLVVDGGASMRCAVLGDLLAAKAVDSGWSGLIINACIRDSVEIAAMDIGVKALGTHPLKTEKRGVGEENIPVNFMNVTFRPGEYLYADRDGVIVSPLPLF